MFFLTLCMGRFTSLRVFNSFLLTFLPRILLGLWHFPVFALHWIGYVLRIDLVRFFIWPLELALKLFFFHRLYWNESYKTHLYTRLDEEPNDHIFCFESLQQSACARLVIWIVNDSEQNHPNQVKEQREADNYENWPEVDNEIGRLVACFFKRFVVRRSLVFELKYTIQQILRLDDVQIC